MPTASPTDTQAARVIAFRKASLRKTSVESSQSSVSGLGSFLTWDVPSHGYLGRNRVLMAGTGVTSTADPVQQADFPQAVMQRLEIRDSSAGMLHSCKGMSNFLQAKYFSPRVGRDYGMSGDLRVFNDDARSVATTSLRASWDVWIEAGTKDNLGLVPNQSAAFKYTIGAQLAPTSDLFTTSANFNGSTLTFQPVDRYYTVPQPKRSADNVAQQIAPQFRGIVRQVWDETRSVTTTGTSIRMDLKPGKVIRNLCLVTRSNSASPGNYLPRAGGITRITLKYGSDIVLHDWLEQDLMAESYDRYGFVPEFGVYPLTFANDADTIIGADYRRDLVDARELAQIWLDITFASGTGNVDIIHDELIVPRGVEI